MNSTPRTIAKILVATDFSKHSKVALARAADIALAFHSQVTVVHCLPDLTYVPSASEFGLPLNDYMVMQEEFRQQATEAMKNFLEGTIPQELSVSSKMLIGDPHFEVSQFAEKEKTDLVVAGRSGHSGWDQFFFCRRRCIQCPAWNGIKTPSR